MRLEPLYRARFAYEEHATARLQGGLEHHFWIAEGRAEGSITGRIRGANHPQRRPDGVFCPEFQGVIETDDGAKIAFDYRGYGRARDYGREVVGTALHSTGDDRYARLNDAVSVLSGEARERTIKLEIAELVWEPPPT